MRTIRRGRYARHATVYRGVEDPVAEDQQEALQKLRWYARWQILVRIGFNDAYQSERLSVNAESLEVDFGSTRLLSLTALFNELGNQSSPSSLVTRSNPSPVVAVEVLVKIDEVAPVRIVLKLF